MIIQKRFERIQLGLDFRIVLAFSLFLLTACNRSSSGLRSDNDNGQSFASEYYNHRYLKSSSQRVEALGQPKKSVLVLDFSNDTPIKQENLGSFVASELKRGLELTQRVIVPENLKSEMTTEDFIAGDRIKVAQLIREGRRLGVAVIIIGRVGKIVFRQKGDDVGLFRKKESIVGVELEAKIFDVQSGRELNALTRSGELATRALSAFESKEETSTEMNREEMIKSASREAIAGFLPEILKSVEKMTWQGRIAKIEGQKIYLNAGKVSGLMPKDILRVLTSGTDVYDPTSGAFLGREKGQLKGTLEVEDYIGTDGAVARLHTGGNFQEGDLVQLY